MSLKKGFFSFSYLLATLFTLSPSLLLSLSGYIGNFRTNTVSVFDTSTNTVTGTITVGAASPGPLTIGVSGMAIQGNSIYVANAWDNTLSVIDMKTNTVTSTISVGKGPLDVAINGNYVYVVNNGSVSDNGSISVVNMKDHSVTTIESSSFNGPIAIAFRGNYAYVPNYGNLGAGNTVSIIDIKSYATVGVITLGPANTAPTAIAIRGAYAYVANNSNPGTVSIIDTNTNTLVGTINAPTSFNQPNDIVIMGNYAYVPNLNTVSVIDLTNNDVVATLTVSSANNSDFSNAIVSGECVYISNFGNNTVSVINTKTGVISLVNDPSNTISGPGYIVIPSVLYDSSRLELINQGQIADAQNKLREAGL